MIRQFCEVCKKGLDMKVVSENAFKNFIWCQCSECKGIAPYKQLKAKDTGFHKGASQKTEGKNQHLERKM